MTAFRVLRPGHVCVVCLRKLRVLSRAFHDGAWTYCRKDAE